MSAFFFTLSPLSPSVFLQLLQILPQGRALLLGMLHEGRQFLPHLVKIRKYRLHELQAGMKGNKMQILTSSYAPLLELLLNFAPSPVPHLSYSFLLPL